MAVLGGLSRPGLARQAILRIATQDPCDSGFADARKSTGPHYMKPCGLGAAQREGARRPRLSIRLGAMVAELSS
jgi:hypothetical protein